MIGQIKFNNLKSYDDFNLKLINVNVEYPTPKVIKQSVPYQNGEYDFTELYGGTSYNNRKITIEFEYNEGKGITRTNLNVHYSKVINWLYGADRSKLYIDFEKGYYTGRVINISSIESLNNTGKITVEFECYPFKINELLEGNDIWDEFNFELDYAQDTKFNINGTENIVIYNDSIINKTPDIVCTSDFEIIQKGVTFKFKAGIYKDYRFKLYRGENNLIIKGNGSIEFKFYKEVL